MVKPSGIDVPVLLIEGFGPGFFRINGTVYEGPRAMLPSGVRAWVGLPDLNLFLAEADSFDVLLVGMGPELKPLPAALRAPFEAVDIGVDIMSSAAAARTYNLLLAEGRRVAAALMPL